MTHRLRRRPPLLALICFSLLFLSAHAFGWGFRPTVKDESRKNRITDQDGRGELHDTEGPVAADKFREASTILRSIRTPPRRLARFTKPTSMFGTTVYYAREIAQLLFMNGPPKPGLSSSISGKLSEPLRKAVDLLSQAADEYNPDAIFKLAEMSFYGTHTYPRNYTQAFDHYSLLADLYGNSTAQHMLGFMYATGIGGSVEKDQARALLYHTFAADAGDIRSQMTLGYRYLSGIATPRDCEKAVRYYKQVADRVMAYVRSGPPGGQSIVKEAARIADEDGGVYGLHEKTGNPVSSESGAFGDVLEYIYVMSKKGEIKATFAIGKMHYEGSRALQRDFRIAKEKFLEVARRYWKPDGSIRQNTEKGIEEYASKAAGYLGRMFLRGEGMDQNFAKARIWFGRGNTNGDALSQYSLGIMYLHGLGVPKDPVKAAEYFGAAADENFKTAQVRLGALFMDQGNLDTAYKYFELAADNYGHIEAFYFLAEIINLGAGRERNCNQAALFYKIVAEKAESVHSNFGEANDAYEDGDIETALQLYMQAAEQGYEIGQANVAYLLDRASGASRSKLARLVAKSSSYFTLTKKVTEKARNLLGDATLSLIYWTRSAKQANDESLLKMGDYYLLGLGTASSGIDGSPDAEKAAACYSAAADTMRSAQAYWNLGWMHENGLGVEQDFHLAKRYYDQCGETDKAARATVALALTKLRVRSWWNWISGGKVHGMHADDGEGKRRKYSFSEWLANFVAADLEDMLKAEQQREMDEWDPASGLRNTAGGDPNQGLHGDEYWGEAGDGLLEMGVIVMLAAALATLVWFRQMAALRERRQQAQADARANVAAAPGAQPGGENLFAPDQAAANDIGDLNNNIPEAANAAAQDEAAANRDDRGFFPHPGDPEFPEWVAGGVGH